MAISYLQVFMFPNRNKKVAPIIDFKIGTMLIEEKI